MNGGDQESDGDLMAETDELTYECAPRQKHPVLFDEPIALYVIIYVYLHIISNTIFLYFFRLIDGISHVLE